MRSGALRVARTRTITTAEPCPRPHRTTARNVSDTVRAAADPQTRISAIPALRRRPREPWRASPATSAVDAGAAHLGALATSRSDGGPPVRQAALGDWVVDHHEARAPPAHLGERRDVVPGPAPIRQGWRDDGGGWVVSVCVGMRTVSTPATRSSAGMSPTRWPRSSASAKAWTIMMAA
jgi:hypothetical protein